MNQITEEREVLIDNMEERNSNSVTSRILIE